MNKRVTQDDIIYFIVTDRFFGRNKRSVDTSDTTIHGGTLDGILEKLDYLIELGVTTIWVTPVTSPRDSIRFVVTNWAFAVSSQPPIAGDPEPMASPVQCGADIVH